MNYHVAIGEMNTTSLPIFEFRSYGITRIGIIISQVAIQVPSYCQLFNFTSIESTEFVFFLISRYTNTTAPTFLNFAGDCAHVDTLNDAALMQVYSDVRDMEPNEVLGAL